MAEPIKTAAELVDWLFTNSLGERAELISFHSRSAVLAKVEELVASQWNDAIEAVNQMDLAPQFSAHYQNGFELALAEARNSFTLHQSRSHS